MTEPDYLLFTDGSGYKDGYGGWACCVRHVGKKANMFRMGCIVGCTVDRMEMTAILEGLQIVFENMQSRWESRDGEDPEKKPIVRLFSDRENLVLSIQKVYDRGNCPDLWARYAYYESIMEVHATHVQRETDYPEFSMVDLHASTGRIIAKQYGEALDVPPHM